MPVITERVADILSALCSNDVQTIEASILGTNEYYRVLNILTIVAALNEERSSLTYWTEDDGFPQKTGRIFSVSRIVLDKQAVGGAKIFRLRGWEVPIIVREDVKEALSKQATSGITFELLAVE